MMTSMTSSTVMRPSTWPPSSTTAALTRSSWAKIRATSESAVSAAIAGIPVSITSRTVTAGSVVSRRATGSTTTYSSSALTHQVIVAVNHEDVVRHLGYLLMAPEIAQDQFQGVARTHGDGVRVHDAAGRVLCERQDALDAFPVARVHGVEQLPGGRLRKLLEDVGEVVGLERLGRGQEPLGVEVREQLGARVLVHVLQDERLGVRVERFPQGLAKPGRRGLDELRGVRRLQRSQLVEDLVERARVGRPQDLLQLVLDVLVHRGAFPAVPFARGARHPAMRRGLTRPRRSGPPRAARWPPWPRPRRRPRWSRGSSFRVMRQASSRS